jgi:hypothetical protein
MGGLFFCRGRCKLSQTLPALRGPFAGKSVPQPSGLLFNLVCSSLVSVGAGFSRRGRTKFGFLDRRPQRPRGG